MAKSARRYIKRQVLTGYLKTAKDVQMKLEELGHPMSYQSAINVLHSVEIYAEIKKKKPLLTEKHKKARLTWAKKHQYWTMVANIIGRKNAIVYSPTISTLL
ncbi:hypothetical protein G6F37_014123 [Rhizopus arrhizus]|nr:hypothetical protein G6F37_014123 [Rhizopus arrhizus]